MKYFLNSILPMSEYMRPQKYKLHLKIFIAIDTLNSDRSSEILNRHGFHIYINILKPGLETFI